MTVRWFSRAPSTEAIKQLWEHTKFSGKDVIVGVANQKVIVRQVDLPWQPLDELKESLPFAVQDTIPMAVDQALLDYYPLEELTTEDGTRTYRGLLVAAQRDMVEAQLQAVTDAGLRRSWSTSPPSRCSARWPTATTSAWAARWRP